MVIIFFNYFIIYLEAKMSYELQNDVIFGLCFWEQTEVN